MTRILSMLLMAATLFVAACESTPKREDRLPEPEPERRPEPKPAPPPKPVKPQLDKSKPPERPWQAPVRESIKQSDYPRPTFADFMDKTIAPWRNALSPAFVPGTPHAMKNVQTNGSWSNGKATLKTESQTVNRGWQAHGYAEATYNSNGAIYAKCYYREGKLHGPATFYNEDGSLKTIECYYLGATSGPIAHFTDGAISKTGAFINGQATGDWLEWDAEGLLVRRGVYELRGGKSTRLWQRSYNAAGETTTLLDDTAGWLAGDQATWVEPKLDEEGKDINAGSVGRCELAHFVGGKLHGWQSIYHRTLGYRIFDTWYENGEQTGPFIEYSKDGKILKQGHRKAGNASGPWKQYTDTYTYEMTYNDEGVLHGPYKILNADGTEYSKGQYKDGRRSGRWTTTDSTGARLEYGYNDEGLYHGANSKVDKDGNTVFQGEYSNGRKTGRWTETANASGLRPEVFSVGTFWRGEGDYLDDLRAGAWTWHWGSGTKAGEGTYTAGKRTGPWKYYFADGTTLQLEATFENDQPKGVLTTYFESGVKAIEKTYGSNGRLDGRYTFWHENGELAGRGTYAPGNPADLQVGEWDAFDTTGTLVARRVYDARGVLQGRLERESALTDAPEGVEIDRQNINGIWKLYNAAGTNHSRRMRVVNGSVSGLFQEFYADGTLGIEGEMLGNTRTGLWKFYYANGKQKEEGTFVNGVLTGPYKKFRESGTLQEEGEYTAGKRQGVVKTYYDDGVTLASEISYSASGGYDGVFKQWHSNGQPKVDSTYTDGKRTGPFTEWYSNGQIHTQGSYANNINAGEWKSWYSDGKPRYERQYDDNGKPKGIWKEWNADGSLKSEVNRDEIEGE